MITRPDFSKKQIIFVFPLRGDKISFSNDNIVIRDGDGKIKHQSTCYRLFMVCIVGDVTITTGLIRRAQKFGFTICLMTSSMKLYETIGSTMEGNTLLHRKQYEYSGDEIGKYIIQNKISNQLAAIRGLRIKTDRCKERTALLKQYVSDCNHAKSIQELLGIEGNAARVYFREIFSSADWNGRQPRIKRDYINSSLDIAYTILFNFIDALLGVYDFDTYQGVLHKRFYMRKSLVCDLVEPFRPLMDLQMRKCINYGQIKEADFHEYNHRMVLDWKQNSKYVQLLLNPLIERKDDIFLYIQNYYRCFMKGTDIEAYPIFKL